MLSSSSQLFKIVDLYMEGIIFVGIPATGKSSFYKEVFFRTHLRINLDMLNTRRKEHTLLDTCLELQQRVVIDNTNPTIEDRNKYISKFKSRKYKIIGYFFQSRIDDALQRNAERVGKEYIPELGVRSVHSKLELPSLQEGFDELYYVNIVNGKFTVVNWKNEI